MQSIFYCGIMHPFQKRGAKHADQRNFDSNFHSHLPWRNGVAGVSLFEKELFVRGLFPRRTETRASCDRYECGSFRYECVFADGALEFIQWGHISNPALTDAIESSCHQQHQQHEDTPHKCHEYFSHKLYSSFWRAHTASLPDASRKYMQTYSKWSK